MNLGFLFTLTLVAFFPVLSAQAQIKKECRGSVPAFYFKNTTSPTQYVQNQSSDILTQLHGETQQGAVGGLGGGEIGFKTESSFEIYQRSQEACVILKSVTVTFYTRPKIHIASDFPRGSCEFNAVLEHERKHVGVLQAYVKERTPHAKSHIANIIRRIKPAIGPIHPRQVDKAQEAMQKGLQSHIEAYNDQIMPELMKRQIAIDTPEEYARVTRQCKDWDKHKRKSKQSR